VYGIDTRPAPRRHSDQGSQAAGIAILRHEKAAVVAAVAAVADIPTAPTTLATAATNAGR
jgi:hypothetical protein